MREEEWEGEGRRGKGSLRGGGGRAKYFFSGPKFLPRNGLLTWPKLKWMEWNWTWQFVNELKIDGMELRFLV